MSTYYLELLSVQAPFHFDVDQNNREMFAVNFLALALAPSDAFEEEVVKILSNAGLATLGTDTFIGPIRTIPNGDGPFLTVNTTGGESPEETHNGTKYERLSVQVVIRGDYEAARTRALAVWRALDGVRNTTVAS